MKAEDKKSKSITPIPLTKSLFWDVDVQSIDFNKHKRFIIGRVLMRGSFDDFLNILDYYGEDVIKEEVKQMRYLDKKTLRFCSFYFHIPLENFRCYKQRQSNNIPSPF